MKPLRQYAKVVWTAADVQTIAPAWTIKQCEEFLRKEERHIQDRLIELGWEVLEILVPSDAKKADES